VRSIELSRRNFKQAAPNAHVGAASFGFIRASEILSCKHGMKKSTWSMSSYREIANKTNHGCVAQFSRSFVDRRKDGQRSEASGIVKPDTSVSGAWMFADSRLRVVRISSRTCPERVLRARYLALIIGVHSKFGRSAGEIRANLSRQNSRGRLLAWHHQTFCLVCLYFFFRTFLILEWSFFERL